jgi:prepilin-type N-terminal cleavage/methylation domain-containing protein
MNRIYPPLALDRAGFTMVELIITLGMIAVVLGIALPRLDLEGARVRGSAHEIVSTLTAAQSRSVLNQHDVVIRFDTAAATALVHLDADNDGTLDAGESTTLVGLGDGVLFDRGQAPAMPQGDGAVSFTQLRGGLPSLTFHRNGSASQMGVIYLSAGLRGRAEARNVRAIDVSRSTGRSVCSRIRAGAWEASC